MKTVYKNRVINARKRSGFPFYFACVSNRNGGKLGSVERDEEGGFSSPQEATETAMHEIDQGFYEDN